MDPKERSARQSPEVGELLQEIRLADLRSDIGPLIPTLCQNWKA